MKLFSRNIFITLFIFLLLATLYPMILEQFKEVEEISLSALAEKIKAGNVERIEVSGDTLQVFTAGEREFVSKKEAEAGLTETLKNYGVTTEEFSKIDIAVKNPTGFAFWVGAILPFLAPFLLIILFFWLISRQVKQANVQAFTFGRSKARVIMPDNKKDRATFADVAGVEEAKEELREVVEFLKTPAKFLKIGARIPKGVLLMGPPGAGKTLLARAVAGEASVPFFHISASEFVEMFVGVGASRVRDLFKMAKRTAPAIIFIDEIDAIGRHRGAGLGGGNDEREQTLNQILVELDGFEPHESVIVMAATNRPDVLDPALLRPGRFDRRVILDLPDLKAREAILKIHAIKKPLAKEVNLRVVAERTPGFSGADLQNLMNEGAILAARKDQKHIIQQDLLISIEKVMLGPERRSHILTPDEKKISAYHEAGHALVATAMPAADPVHKVSIISRGRAAGYTLKLPIEDRHLYSKLHFLAELAVSLGGYAAEKIIFGELTTGASNDLKQATAVARDMVTKYGMSEKVGPVNLGSGEDMVFLGREIASGQHYSEKMASEVDGEVSRFMREGFKKATELLKKHKNILEAIAKYLIEKETIERDEFNNLVKSFGLIPKTALETA
ncbi:MAG: ATP-dependent zinc metalloprotease FtsH [Candidatus Niyogibacteria bacterium]|nr:MAG: ATP-dependent zinc metalloprotease FtsH [Candidatus Niyogibacteria bacterium]